jgi:multisubunit Na+/H+ antiporter MnhG subunit
MRYIVATIGAVFVFIAAFLIILVLVALLPPAFRPVVHLGFLWINNPLALLGLALAALAAVHSFRSTVRHYEEKAKASARSDANQAASPRLH